LTKIANDIFEEARDEDKY